MDCKFLCDFENYLARYWPDGYVKYMGQNTIMKHVQTNLYINYSLLLRQTKISTVQSYAQVLGHKLDHDMSKLRKNIY